LRRRKIKTKWKSYELEAVTTKHIRLFGDAKRMNVERGLIPGGISASGKWFLFTGSSISVALTCNLLAGCAVGPDFQKPPAPEVTGSMPKPLVHHTVSAESRGGAAQHFVQDLDIPGQWWEIFHSRALNDLIEDALKHNPDVQAAQAGLRVARETTEAPVSRPFGVSLL
jgi:hypothetical protein